MDAARPRSDRARRRHAAVLLFALTVGACGGTPSEPRTAGVRDGFPSAGGEARAEGAIELALRRPDGSFLDIGEMRGTPILIFVFATFDAVSQVALHPLQEIARAHPDLPIIGIAAQPGARLLVEAYEHALNPPFQVTYDPAETVSEGQSSLGPIEAVPMFIMLDRRGVPVGRHVGFAEQAELEALVRAGGAR